MVCCRILSGFSREDIEEAVADCFASLWRSAASMQIETTVRQYLIGIARNCALSKLKKLLRSKGQVSLDELNLGIDLDMTSNAVKHINIQILREVLNEMPEVERNIFIRRYYHYESIRSIAENMGITPKKVENILSRYKAVLRTQLIERGVVL